MKKIEKAGELFWIFGIVFVAMGVALCSKANLGVSMIAAPTFIVFDALSEIFPWLTVGTMEYIIQGVVLILLCIAIRQFHWQYLCAFLAAMLYGFTMDFFLFLFRDLNPENPVARYFLLFAGLLMTAIGVASFFRTYLPLQIHELFVAEFSKVYKMDISKVKWTYDISLLVISLVLLLVLFVFKEDFDWSQIGVRSFHNIGTGTIIATFVNAPMIKFMGKLLDKVFGTQARSAKLEKIFRT